MPGAPCSLTRDPNRGNAVVEVHNCFFNLGEVKTDGLDLTLRTNFDLGAGGKLTNVLQASWSYEFTIVGGVDQSGLQGFLSPRADLTNQLRRGDWVERKSVQKGKSVSGRVDLGGPGLMKKKNV